MAIALKTVRLAPKPNNGHRIKPFLVGLFSDMREKGHASGAVARQLLGLPITRQQLENLGAITRYTQEGRPDSLTALGRIIELDETIVDLVAQKTEAKRMHTADDRNDTLLMREIFLRRLLTPESFEPLPEEAS
ncbi:MAG: hypothetical protein HQ596_01185 [Candidatus Saganbacteria bacterium]|nr:hypothetical protein [Candidatus Saganbacteria bacterium]